MWRPPGRIGSLLKVSGTLWDASGAFWRLPGRHFCGFSWPRDQFWLFFVCFCCFLWGLTSRGPRQDGGVYPPRSGALVVYGFLGTLRQHGGVYPPGALGKGLFFIGLDRPMTLSLSKPQGPADIKSSVGVGLNPSLRGLDSVPRSCERHSATTSEAPRKLGCASFVGLGFRV